RTAAPTCRSTSPRCRRWRSPSGPTAPPPSRPTRCATAARAAPASSSDGWTRTTAGSWPPPATTTCWRCCARANRWAPRSPCGRPRRATAPHSEPGTGRPVRAPGSGQSELAGEPFDVRGDLVVGAVRQPEQHLGDAQVAPAGQFVRVGLEIQGDDLRCAVPAGIGPDVLQQLDRFVDVDVARRGDPAVGGAGDPLEVLLGAGRADQHRDVRLHRLRPCPTRPEADELALI